MLISLEKVHYKTDVFNVYKEHDKQYIFSTGGDYDYSKSKAYPGMAIYHQGRVGNLENWNVTKLMHSKKNVTKLLQKYTSVSCRS
jgi:hypothetical protein